MNGKFNARTLVESKPFTQKLQEISSIKNSDEAIAVLLWAISTKPEFFPVIPGTTQLRIAKTNFYEREGTFIPPLRLWFKIVDEDTIELLYIETIDILDNNE